MSTSLQPANQHPTPWLCDGKHILTGEEPATSLLALQDAILSGMRIDASEFVSVSAPTMLVYLTKSEASAC